MLKKLSQRTIPASINDIPLLLEVSDTSDTRQKGLMGIESMPLNKGMIFRFDELDHHGMWMKNTRVHLACLFLNRNNEIVDIQHMEPLSTDIHRPSVPVQMVIEVNSSLVDDHGIKVGDKVKFT